MKWIDSFLQTMNDIPLTDDQHLLISCYQIEFCGVDEENSDVENILAVHEAAPSSSFLSPRAPSLSELPDGLHSGTAYPLFSFLSFIWMALDGMEFSKEWKHDNKNEGNYLWNRNLMNRNTGSCAKWMSKSTVLDRGTNVHVNGKWHLSWCLGERWRAYGVWRLWGCIYDI